ncbi:MAG: ECF RNA polymerase sigma factor SigE [Bacteroidota bacterium]|nr:MAG: ECF RNA polymerase sigma factor SigE [Bacteroidota bacterium]
MDKGAFLQRILAVQDSMFRLAKRLLKSTEEAEDAVQEVLAKLWKNMNTLTTIANLEGYAMTMTKNYCLDRLKSKQAAQLRLVYFKHDRAIASLDQQIDDRDSVAQVYDFLEALPEQQKLVLQLRDVEQYDFETIAKITELSEGAVRVALSRARKTIREKLIKSHQHGIGTGS